MIGSLGPLGRFLEHAKCRLKAFAKDSVCRRVSITEYSVIFNCLRYLDETTSHKQRMYCIAERMSLEVVCFKIRAQISFPPLNLSKPLRGAIRHS